jgi:putative acetyltransferase
MVDIRPFLPDDSAALARIFYDAVQIGAVGEYTQAERNAWCPQLPPDDWAQMRFAGLVTFVAWIDTPVGFMNIDRSGYLDMAFVAPAYTGQGIARALHDRIVAQARAWQLNSISTFASHTARPAFIAMGWDAIRANSVEKGSVTLQNWFMIKQLLA